MLFKKIPWQDPIKLARAVSVDESYLQDWIFLNSGLSTNIAGSKSYLALYPKKEIISNNFQELEVELDKTESDLKWFGYLSYDLKNSLEKLMVDDESRINLPNLWFMSFHLILEFDHDKKTIDCFFDDDFFTKLPKAVELDYIDVQKDFKVSNLESNFSKKEYLQKISDIKDRISEGDLYQANLTRKFYGKIESKNKFDIFLRLNEVSPANYSAFLKLGENFIISSSPELFLNIDEEGRVKSSPIKGTSPRFEDQNEDLLSKEFLQNCEKERAENLMIVDLVRNDFSKGCKINSVKVGNLFEIKSYKTLYHMSSDIVGVKDHNISNLEIIKNCFPPASMTGAPKIKAMEVCSELERLRRGVYSGSIGIISKYECNLSVVIRTIIIQNNEFEFQVGGAITHGSHPIKEWEETISKAKGISRAIGVDLENLKKL